MNKLKVIFVFLCAILISSCATTYKRAGNPDGVGYYDSLLQKNMYEVTFNGNSDISSTTAQDYALLRAAEICIENGYKTFDIVNSKDNSKTETGGYINHYGRYQSAAYISSSTYPKIVLIIKCSVENDLTFIAEQIRENLRKKYKLD